MSTWSLFLLYFLGLSSGKVLVVDSEASLAGLALGGFDEIHLRSNITISAGWTSVSFSGTIRGFGYAIDVMSHSGIFDTLSDATLVNLTIVQKNGSTTTGALATTATSVFMTGCVVDISADYGASYSQSSAAGLFTTVASLSLTDCVVRVSVTASGGNPLTQLGGLAVTCETLTVAYSTISITLNLAVSQNLIAGGLAAVAGGISASSSSITFVPTYTGTGGVLLGGLIGEVENQASTISKVTLRIPTGTFKSSSIVRLGGIIGYEGNNITITDSAVYYGTLVMTIASGTFGGIAGQSYGTGTITVMRTTVLADDILMNATSSGTLQFGGVTSGCSRGVFSQMLFRGNVSLYAQTALIQFGSMSGYGATIMGDNSVSSGNVTIYESGNQFVFIGGFVGNCNGGTLLNLVANLTMNATAQTGGVGGIAGQSLASITACQSNISVYMVGTIWSTGIYRCSLGAIVGTAKSIVITASFGIQKISGTGSPLVGGIAGLSTYVLINDSFALTNSTYAAGVQSTFGGLIGYAISCKINNSYSDMNISTSVARTSLVGGLVGYWEGAGSITSSAAYGSMVFTNKTSAANAGTLIGKTPASLSGTLKNCISIMKVTTPENVKIPFMPGASSTPSSCACADLGDVSGCIPANDLTSIETLKNKGVDLSGTFGTQSGLMHGYVFPTSVPVPNDDGSKFTLVNPTGSSWSGNNWSISGSGLPSLNVNYGYTCSLVSGCHGTPTSSGSITCSPGWTGNTTSPCATYTCSSNTDCNGGTCSSGKCATCPASYTGPDCTQQPCGPNGKLVNNICVCESDKYFINSVGQCTLGCPSGCGHGTCTGANQCACFAGYQSQGSNACSMYSCNTVAPACFNAATCLQNSTSGSYECRCSSKTQYFKLGATTGSCVEGCPTILMGYCIGDNKAACDAGWVNSDGKLCNKYDCTLAPADSVCGGAGTCNHKTKTCECAFNAKLDTYGSCVFQDCVGLQHGTCTDNKYTCHAGWENAAGGKCNKYNCAIDTSSNVCGNAGTCDKTTKICRCANNAATLYETSCLCNQGWYSSGSLCGMYNCTIAGSTNLCNNLGFCTSSGTCTCLQTAEPSTGTCKSITDKCPNCQNGNCLYDTATSKPQCVCSSGYGLVGDTCYQNNCGACGNGTCKNNDATKTITCTCNDGFRLINGVCYKDVCGQCANGTCLADPAFLTFACRCDAAYLPVDDVCFLNNCLVCTNGTCASDPMTRTISCVCKDGRPPVFGVCTVNKSPLIIKIVVPIVVCVAVVVIIAVVVAVVCIRKRRREWSVAAQPTEALKFGDFSTTIHSNVQ